MANPEIVIVGSCMIDLCCYVSRLPRSSETLEGYKFKKGFGGKGANQCVSAARLGARTGLVARLGDDVFAKEYLEELQNGGINTKHVTVTKGVSSGMAQITVADSGENQIVIVPGANTYLDEQDVNNAKEMIINAKIVLFQMETPLKTTMHTLQLMQGNPGISILNVAPASSSLPPEIYDLVDILCVNEVEAETISGHSALSVSEAILVAKDLQQRSKSGRCSIVLTLGEFGAVVAEAGGKDAIHIPVPKHKSTFGAAPVVDSTGAGDSFLGALAFFLARCPKLLLTEMVSRACAVASISVRAEGTQTSFPYAHQLPPEILMNC
ncbi:ribokinase-like isoform X1 [Schistocerca gregaria]|uniref:ribokinase-like isoform X1 n=1 Tax=Schistocerca gregaria TaxID=7010 RepID=UPI00211E3715|nr:ribokinase-like isoform X1 [Schistocerca gregaria]